MQMILGNGVYAAIEVVPCSRAEQVDASVPLLTRRQCPISFWLDTRGEGGRLGIPEGDSCQGDSHPKRVKQIASAHRSRQFNRSRVGGRTF